MAIEVVKEGNRNPDEQFHATCKCCGAVLNFLRKDGYTEAKTAIQCPRCKELTMERDWEKGKAPAEVPTE